MFVQCNRMSLTTHATWKTSASVVALPLSIFPQLLSFGVSLLRPLLRELMVIQIILNDSCDVKELAKYYNIMNYNHASL